MAWNGCIATFEIRYTISHVETIEITASINVASNIPDTMRRTITFIKRRWAAFEKCYGICNIEPVVIETTVNISGYILAGRWRFREHYRAKVIVSPASDP
jgi:hypothetical protein